MKNKLEQKLDAEFKRMNVKPFIHHFIDTAPFSAITIVSFHSSWKEIARYIHEESKSPLVYINQASYLLRNLAHNRHIYGVAICDRRDQFNRQRGRIIAKGRLLKHLKLIEKGWKHASEEEKRELSLFVSSQIRCPFDEEQNLYFLEKERLNRSLKK